jgi:hypothetical protein
MNTAARRLGSFWLAAASALIVACGGGGAGVGGECESSEDCRGSLVCDPGTLTCTEAGGACQSHAECGAGGICNAEGSCEANQRGGPCDTGSDCVGGQICGAGNTCVDASGGADGGDECGAELFEADAIPPNVLIVVDRTGSMNNPPNGGGRDKWEIAQDVVSDLVARFGDDIHFGLMLFPGFDQSGDEGVRCGRGEVFVDPGAGTAGQIADIINDAGTTGFRTPIEPTFNYLHPGIGWENGDGDLEFWTGNNLDATDRDNYILLISDGEDTCEEVESDPVRGVESHRDRQPDVRTIVVGFGGDVVDSQELSDMAAAGGLPRDGDPNYYLAESEEALEEALATIAGSLISCTLTLREVPPNTDELYAFIDGDRISRDESREDGWDYLEDTNQVVFYGAACERIQAGADSVRIIFGCPDDPIIID